MGKSVTHCKVSKLNVKFLNANMLDTCQIFKNKKAESYSKDDRAMRQHSLFS